MSFTSNYLTGTPQEIKNFTAQMNELYKQPGLVVAGSVGRQAMYAAFGLDAAPLPLRTPQGGYRDIDIVTVGRYAEDTDSVAGWHTVDHGLNAYHPTYYSSGPVIADGGGIFAEVDPVVFAPRTRILDGINVHTYSVGTQRRLHHFVAVMLQEYEERYRSPLDTFDEFAEGIRISHPDEFLPPQLYAPFDDVIARSGKSAG